MRIAIACTGTLGMRLLEPLLESHHEVVALLQNKRHTRALQRWFLPRAAKLLFPKQTVLGLARSHGIPVLYIDKMGEEELAPLRALQPDLLLVGGFGIILKEPLLTLPRVGCLNTHSSLLPRHRGPNPFSAVILAKDEETGVTFHVMDPGIDTGDIVEQVRMPVKNNATAGSLYRQTSKLAGEHILRVIERVERDGLRGTPQDNSLAIYDQKMKPENAFIGWNQSAEEVDRLIRACAPFMLARFRHRGRVIYLYRSRFDTTPVDAAPGTILEVKPNVKIATAEGTVTVMHAYTKTPMPWFWPAPWLRPRAGERVE